MHLRLDLVGVLEQRLLKEEGQFLKSEATQEMEYVLKNEETVLMASLELELHEPPEGVRLSPLHQPHRQMVEVILDAPVVIQLALSLSPLSQSLQFLLLPDLPCVPPSLQPYELHRSEYTG